MKTNKKRMSFLARFLIAGLMVIMMGLGIGIVDAHASSDAEYLIAYAVGTMIGAALTDYENAPYYPAADPLRIQYPQKNAIGGVMPLSKGGSLNTNKTYVTDKNGNTSGVESYTDIYGNKHMFIYGE